MATYTRSDIIFDGDTFHVTWQCHNQDWLLKSNWAKELYYNLLLRYKDKYAVTIYSYNFMDNHPHLSGKLDSRELFSAFFKLVNSRFAREVNKRMNRRGQVVMDRFQSPRIKSDQELLRAMAYIDLNQVRAKKVKRVEDSRWSSYRYYAFGEKDELITMAPTYEELGTTPDERQIVYREMVAAILESDETICITGTHFIGDPKWVKEQYENLREMGRIRREAQRKNMIQRMYQRE